jgi:hypothetical protein
MMRTMRARLREGSTIVALILAAAIAVVAVLGLDHKERVTRPTIGSFSRQSSARHPVGDASG